MKHLRILVLIVLAFLPRLFGGALPVVDAAALAGQQRDYIEQMFHAVQGEEEIRRLAQQIVQLDESLKRLGDPSVISKLAGSDLLADYLRRSEMNSPTADLLNNASVPQLLKSDPLLGNAGVGSSVTIAGKAVAPRDEVSYRPEAVVQQGLNQYEAVRAEVLNRRAALKRQIAANLEQMKSASTQSEVLKLTAVASSLHAELESVDRDLELAALEVAHIDQAKKLRAEVARKAQVENERAALSISSKRDAVTFRLSSEPVMFNR